ncbi:uncharacterized protein ACIGJ3_007964 isoform 1-T1 [Trichechus inunguis]
MILLKNEKTFIIECLLHEEPCNMCFEMMQVRNVSSLLSSDLFTMFVNHDSESNTSQEVKLSELISHLGCSGKTQLIKGQLLLCLKKAREWAMCTSGRNEFQEEKTTSLNPTGHPEKPL